MAEEAIRVVNLDKLTYAGNLRAVDSAIGRPNYVFVRGDVRDRGLVGAVLNTYQPAAVVHLAAETHVDRSIADCSEFVQTNVQGTTCLLEATREYLDDMPSDLRESFRFLHVSTDEVYGSLGPDDPPFTEVSPYAPSSPYSASKAASDHFVRAYRRTYGLPTIITNCSNNYGPWQNPEKLIPLTILHALEGRPLPVYGDGGNVRDWLFVEDHCRALWQVLTDGTVGETYNIGGGCERTNLQVVKAIREIVNSKSPIEFVADRLGHDRRYAIDSGKIKRELGWRPAYSFDFGLRQTVEWYVGNRHG